MIRDRLRDISKMSIELHPSSAAAVPSRTPRSPSATRTPRRPSTTAAGSVRAARHPRSADYPSWPAAAEAAASASGRRRTRTARPLSPPTPPRGTPLAEAFRAAAGSAAGASRAAVSPLLRVMAVPFLLLIICRLMAPFQTCLRTCQIRLIIQGWNVRCTRP